MEIQFYSLRRLTTELKDPQTSTSAWLTNYILQQHLYPALTLSDVIKEDIHMGSEGQNYQMWKIEVLRMQLGAKQYPEAHVRPPSFPKV